MRIVAMFILLGITSGCLTTDANPKLKKPPVQYTRTGEVDGTLRRK